MGLVWRSLRNLNFHGPAVGKALVVTLAYHCHCVRWLKEASMRLQSQDPFCTFVVALSLELWEPHVYTLSNSFVPGMCPTLRNETPMRFACVYLTLSSRNDQSRWPFPEYYFGNFKEGNRMDQLKQESLSQRQKNMFKAFRN